MLITHNWNFSITVPYHKDDLCDQRNEYTIIIRQYPRLLKPHSNIRQWLRLSLHLTFIEYINKIIK